MGLTQVKQIMCNMNQLTVSALLTALGALDITAEHFFNYNSSWTGTYQSDRSVLLESGVYAPPLLYGRYVPILYPNLGYESAYNFRFIAKGANFSIGCVLNPITLYGYTLNGGYQFDPVAGTAKIFLEDGSADDMIAQTLVYSAAGLSGFSNAQMNTFDITVYLSEGMINTIRVAISVNKTLVDVSPRIAFDYISPVVLSPFIRASNGLLDAECYLEQMSVTR